MLARARTAARRHCRSLLAALGLAYTQLVHDLKTLRELATYLEQYDAVTFLGCGLLPNSLLV